MSACSTLTSHEEHQKVHDMVVDSRGALGLAGWIVLKSTRMRNQRICNIRSDPESETYTIVLKSQKDRASA